MRLPLFLYILISSLSLTKFCLLCFFFDDTSNNFVFCIIFIFNMFSYQTINKLYIKLESYIIITLLLLFIILFNLNNNNK